LEKWNLPKGWEWVRLREVTDDFISGGTPSTKNCELWKGNIPWTTSANLSGCILREGSKFINGDAIKNSATNIVQKDNVLIATRVGIGKSVVNTIDIAISQDITGLIIDKQRVNPNFIVRFLHHPYVIKELEKLSQGSTIKGLQRSHIENLAIPIPPLETQQKIVAILDKAEEIKRLRAEANAQTQKLIQSVFLDMFGDPVKNPKGWSTSRIGDVTSKISSGSTPLGGREVYSKSGKLFIRSQNVLMNRLNLDDVAYIDNATHTNMKRTWVNCGDVLLNITGASIGRVAWYDGENGSANVNQHVCIIRPNHKMILPEVLAFQISMPSFQQKIMMKQSGATRQAFTFTQISDFKIILPDLALQNHFLSIMRAINGVGQKQKEQDSQLLLNKNNLLSNAFNGELVA